MNPFQPPEPVTEELAIPPVEKVESDATARTRDYVWWAIVLAMNILLPAFLALAVTSPRGMFGMALAVGCFYAAGCWVHYRVPHVGRSLNAGGVAVALTQFVPLLQIFAGAAGIEVARVLGGMGDEGDQTPMGSLMSTWGAFVCTITTGLILVSIALIVGAIFATISGTFRGNKTADHSRAD